MYYSVSMPAESCIPKCINGNADFNVGILNNLSKFTSYNFANCICCSFQKLGSLLV